MLPEGIILVANTGDDTLTCIDFGNRKKYSFDLIGMASHNNTMIKGLENYILGPYDLVDGRQNFIYCTNVYDNSVARLDLVARDIVDIISVGSYPTCIKYYDGYLIVANTDSNSISIIDEKDFSLVENIPVGEKPTYIEIDKANKDLYIVNSGGYSIDIVGLEKNYHRSFKLGSNPVKIAIFEDLIYILSNVNNGSVYSSNISIFSLTDYKEKSNVLLKGFFSNMLKINNREIIFITNMENGCLYRMDAQENNLLSKTYLDGMPNQLEWDGDGTLFITNISTDVVTVFDVDANKILTNIEVGKEPSGILILNQNHVYRTGNSSF